MRKWPRAFFCEHADPERTLPCVLRRRFYLLLQAVYALRFGFIGMFVPVLPTTPLVLLAAFLFSRSSERLSSWIAQTPIYRAYVEPFKQSGGISLPRKMRILAISYSVMGLSAFLVQKPVVWIVLAAVAVFLAVLMLAIIPTISKERELDHGDGLELDSVARVRERD